MWIPYGCLLAFLPGLVLALGSKCTTPLSPKAGSSNPFWVEAIDRKGISAYNPNSSTYKVYRNVKDYGAIGDGETDDSAAINAAIADQNRCGQGCKSSTKSPGLIYFPAGTYALSSPIIPFYYTQLVGNAKNKPVLLAKPDFKGIAVIDADPYLPDGTQYWQNQNNFFKSVRHFKIDLRQTPTNSSTTGLHWQVSQATTLVDVEVQMSQDPETNHQGIFMENGSGGFMSDLLFVGGKYGIWVGNQQFTVRNLEVRKARSAVFASWNWGWTFQGVKISDCDIGFEILTGGVATGNQTVGSEVIIDASVSNVKTFIQTSGTSPGSLDGSLLLDHIKFSDVGKGVVDGEGKILLEGGNRKIAQWAQGNRYKGAKTTYAFIQKPLTGPPKPTSILDSKGNIFGRMRPSYSGYLASQFAHVRDSGAAGDGVTDDTAAIQKFIDRYWGCKILFFDAGSYYVTETINIPSGSIVVGEAWATIIGGGKAFSHQDKPKPVVRVGKPGEKGVTEISDMVFSTRGGAQGAIVMEWNTANAPGKKATAAMWDVHIRLGGFAGTNISAVNCAKNTGHPIEPCTAAFLGLHITETASVYAEGTWVWTADHDLEDELEGQIDVYTGRGILSESAYGPVWLIGTGSEHFAMVQYNFVNSRNLYAGLIQTETAYYQPSPEAPKPFAVSPKWHDPPIDRGPSGWSTSIKNSHQIYIYGAGLYSFFSSYEQGCLKDWTCQDSIFRVDSKSTNVFVYGLSTIGTTHMLNVGASPIAKQSDNRNGFASTITVWTSASTGKRSLLLDDNRIVKERPF